MTTRTGSNHKVVLMGRNRERDDGDNAVEDDDADR